MKVYAVYTSDVFGALWHDRYRKIDSVYSNKDAAYKRAKELAEGFCRDFEFVRKAVDRLDSDGRIDVVFMSDPDTPIDAPYSVSDIKRRIIIEELEVID